MTKPVRTGPAKYYVDGLPVSKRALKEAAESPPGSRGDYLTAKEIRQVLRIPVGTVRRWADAGSLGALRAGRATYYSKADLLKLIEERVQ